MKDVSLIVDDSTIVEVQTIVTGKDSFFRKRIIISVIQNYWLMR